MPRGVHPGAAVTPSDRDAVFAPCRFVAAAGRERLAYGPIRNRGHEHGRIIRLAVLESEQEIEAHSLIVARLSVLTTSVVCTEVCITRALPGIGDTSDPHR